MNALTRLCFEDRGQDFLWWDLDDNDMVIDCGPFQKSLWVGTKVLDYGLGSCPAFQSKSCSKVRVLRYRVSALERSEVAA